MAAFGKGRGGLERQIICLKYLIFFLNVLAWMLGAAVFALATWIRFQDDFQEWVVELGFTHYWIGIWILFAVGIFTMIVSFVGCCATFAEMPELLGCYIVLTSITFVLSLAGAAYTLNNGIEYSELTPWLQQRFDFLIDRYIYDMRARRIMAMIQEYVGCCGSRTSDDYDDRGMETPYECRDKVTGNEYNDGCDEVFAWYLETKSGWVAGTALFLCLFQLITIVFAGCLCAALRRESKFHGLGRDPY